ncbi:MAG TPA: hypothetical protein ENJ30_07340 [Desulfobulbaceae bacterium]|nr:hypothetical protein [Desulfobulbaceae bacterium]
MAFVKQMTVAPYLPDRVEALGDNTGQYSDKDIGKAMKQNAAGYLEQCASGDEIYGFVTAVEPATEDGHSIGSVSCDVNKEAYAVDEVGGLTRGARVVAGTPTALGTATPDGGNVIAASAATAVHAWIVVETYGGAAGDRVLLRKV